MPFNPIIFSPRSLELASLVEWAHKSEGRDLGSLFGKLTTCTTPAILGLPPSELRVIHAASILGLREVAFECQKREKELSVKRAYEEIKRSKS